MPKHTFTPGTFVTIVIHGPHGYTHTYAVRVAGSAGGVREGFRIPKGAPLGKYTVSVKGHKHGGKVTLLGTFHVKRK